MILIRREDFLISCFLFCVPKINRRQRPIEVRLTHSSHMCVILPHYKLLKEAVVLSSEALSLHCQPRYSFHRYAHRSRSR